MKKIYFISILMTFASAPVVAGNRSGADFLTLPGGARAIGLGAAAPSLADGVELLNTNPAGIANLAGRNHRQGGLALSHQNFILSSQLTHITGALPVGSFGLGLNITRLSYGDSEARDEEGTLNGTIESSDLAMGAAFAHRVGAVGIGTQIKMIYQKLGSESARGLAVDMGFVSRLGGTRLSVGGAVRNLGAPMRFQEEAYNLPLIVSFSGAFQLAPTFAIGCGVQSRSHQGVMEGGVGTEIQAASMLTLRTGLMMPLGKSNRTFEVNSGQSLNIGSFDGFTSGVGLQLGRFNLDYAVQPLGEMGLTHAMTVMTRFETPASQKAEPTPDHQPVENKNTQPNMLQLDLHPENQFFPPGR